jgi:hypothetical protein
MNEFITKEVMAIVPTYMPDRGNCTIIYTDEENIILDLTVRTIIKKLCAHYHLDIRASNKYFGGLISVKNAVPLPLTRDKILIQLKVRKPIGHCDGCMGYFNLDSIKKIQRVKDKTLIILKNGIEIQCMSTQANIEKHIKNGELIRNLYDNRIYTVNEAMERYEATDTPATKSDIAEDTRNSR